MYGAPWPRKASEEKKLDCCWVRLPAPSRSRSGPPRTKKKAGTRTTTESSIATTCAKSVRTDARNPDQTVYSSTPAAIISTPG